ncbi:hypothetical protein PROFUN_00933 [Planoprotostelium fungivorum]|uniref:Membrane insertase YidC/Oxa/ALB C-terminal domain-containing protein n=1 Tax=Planoprotostelium fungivorum TaxID=1890364 RepID=A0A2P6N482_9EUKA|nr:hypothetical protein PROFUN_00933 [Planoprotostelium fungivorum]
MLRGIHLLQQKSSQTHRTLSHLPIGNLNRSHVLKSRVLSSNVLSVRLNSNSVPPPSSKLDAPPTDHSAAVHPPPVNPATPPQSVGDLPPFDVSSKTDAESLEELYRIMQAQNDKVSKAIDTIPETPASDWSDSIIYQPVHWMQDALASIHEYSGMPWYVTIAATTVFLRILISPMMVKSLRASAASSNAATNPAVLAARRKMDVAKQKYRETKSNADRVKFMEAQRLVMDEMRKVGAAGAMFKALLNPLMQAPLFFTFFVALRNHEFAPALVHGGALWFENLTLPDPYFILPAMNAGVLLGSVWMNAMEATVTEANSSMSKKIGSVMAAFVFFIGTTMPASVLCYWIPSSIMGFAITKTLRRPAVSKFFNIPKIRRADALEDVPTVKIFDQKPEKVTPTPLTAAAAVVTDFKSSEAAKQTAVVLPKGSQPLTSGRSKSRGKR